MLFDDDEEDSSLSTETDEYNVLYMDPPIERADAETDEDSADSNDPEDAEGVHLPRRLLKATGRAKKRRRLAPRVFGHKERNIADNDSDEEHVQAEASDKWTQKKSKKFGSKIPEWKPVPEPEHISKLKEFDDAYDFYKLFQSDDFIQEIIFQSKLYAEQRNKVKHLDFITNGNIRCLEAIMLLSGFCQVPFWRLCWKENSVCYNKFVANLMRRDTFEYVLSVIHFCNNQEITDDRYYKVWPLFDNLNKSKDYCINVKDFSVDEIMIPYYGRHSTKQFIRAKPIRYGYKVWCLATSKGFGVTFEPYCGKDTRVNDAKLGQGPNVVLDLVKKSEVREGCQVFFDNLFTSFPLLQNLSQLGIAGTGTVRQNRLNKVPLPKKKSADNLERGCVKSVYQEDRVCTMWKDSKLHPTSLGMNAILEPRDITALIVNM